MDSNATKKAHVSRDWSPELAPFFVLLLLAAVHRLLTYPELAGGAPLWSDAGRKAIAVGLMSDAWIAALLSLLLVLIGLVLQLFGYGRAGRRLTAFVLVLATVLTCGHQVYVGFFHFPIIPYHLRYLTDVDFIRGNASSLFDWRVLAIVATAGITALVGRWLKPAPKRWRARERWPIYTLILVLCLVAHAENIRWRVQWFVAEPLQVSPVERLYMRAFVDTMPAPVTVAEERWLKASLAGHAPSTLESDTHPVETATLFPLLTRPVAGDPEMLPVAEAIKHNFSASLQAGRKPVAMVLLLESLRPSETGYFAPGAGVSLTPHLDELARAGLAMPQAYSTGGVTRGGQEAAFCGYLGSRATSVMRAAAIADVTCLPDLAHRQTVHGGRRGETFWYHGGDARFDSQGDFWLRHGVQHFLSRQDFPGDVAQTGWGVSDKVFLATAGARLAAMHQSSRAQYLLGLGLSMTNHIPWTYPEDLGALAQLPRASGHPSYVTTAYTDAAVGAFIEDLHGRGLWSDTLLIIASDHGNLLPPLVDLVPGADADHKNTELGSHINLIISGGLAEAAVADLSGPKVLPPAPVSQAGIAAFLAYILDLEPASFFADPLLVKKPALPVFSNLDELIAEHVSGRNYTPTELTKATPAALPAKERLGLLYYRSFLQFIYTPPTKGVAE